LALLDPGRVRGGALGLGAEDLHGARGVVGAVDGRAGHEHVGTRLRAALDGLLADPAVDLEPYRGVPAADQRAGPAQLRQHNVEEGLATEARLHRHQQQHVDLGHQVRIRFHRGARVDRESGPSAGRPDRAQRPDRRARGLGVDRHVPGTGLGVRGSPPVRLLDHQVTVERQRGVLEQRPDDGQAEGQVRHEVVVHDVHMQPVRDAGDRCGLVGEPGEVRGQDTRRDLNGHKGRV
jgi:hypothetical protein